MARWLKKSLSGWSPCPLTYPAKDPEAIREQYAQWLVKTKRCADYERAIDYIYAMPECGIVSQHNGGELGTYERQVKWFGGSVCVRKVPCFTKASGHYQTSFPEYDEQLGWHFPEENAWRWRNKTGGVGVTVYWVMVDGRQVDSFLSSALATAKAKEIAQSLVRRDMAKPPALREAA